LFGDEVPAGLNLYENSPGGTGEGIYILTRACEKLRDHSNIHLKLNALEDAAQLSGVLADGSLLA